MAFMAAAAPYLMAAGGVISSAMSVAEGIGAKKIADRNAQALEYDAQARLAAGRIEARDHRKMIRSLLSTQQTKFSASGLTGKNALQVMEETAAEGELDAQRILFNAETDATRLRNQAILEKWQGKQRRTAGWIKGATGMLSTGVGVGKMIA